MKKINSKKSLSSYKTSSFELYLLIFPFVILFFLTTVLPVLSSIADEDNVFPQYMPYDGSTCEDFLIEGNTFENVFAG